MWTRTMLHKPLFGYKKETISGDINFRKWQILCSGKKQQQKRKTSCYQFDYSNHSATTIWINECCCWNEPSVSYHSFYFTELHFYCTEDWAYETGSGENNGISTNRILSFLTHPTYPPKKHEQIKWHSEQWFSFVVFCMFHL